MIKKKYFKMRNGEYYTRFSKEEIASKIDTTKPETFVPFLKEMDYPYITRAWEKQIKCSPEKESHRFGKYIALMNLMSYRNYHYEDGPCLNELFNPYKKCGVYCNHWEPTCELFNPITKECIYNRNPKALCQDCLYTDKEIKKIKESDNNGSNS